MHKQERVGIVQGFCHMFRSGTARKGDAEGSCQAAEDKYST
jgi:hypothetical protein